MGVLIEILECEDMTLFTDIDHYILSLFHIPHYYMVRASIFTLACMGRRYST